jgi:hypothetical protein
MQCQQSHGNVVLDTLWQSSIGQPTAMQHPRLWDKPPWYNPQTFTEVVMQHGTTRGNGGLDNPWQWRIGQPAAMQHWSTHGKARQTTRGKTASDDPRQATLGQPTDIHHGC